MYTHSLTYKQKACKAFTEATYTVGKQMKTVAKQNNSNSANKHPKMP